MKNKLLIILLLVVSNAMFGAEIKTIGYNEIPEESHILGVDNIKNLYYKEKGESFILDMQGKFSEQGNVDSINFDGDMYYLETSNFYLLENIEYREYSLKVFANGKQKPSYKGSFKFKEHTPLITNDAVVLGILLLLLAFIFKSESSNNSFFKKFYKYVPALLLCYFLPALLNTFGLISADESSLYFIASRYLLPASLVLLCLNIDMQGIKRLGPKALIMFFTATVGIVIGGPIALYLVSLAAPEMLDDEIWRGLSTVAGSWIGGGANQAAMKEVYLASDKIFSAMIIVDVFIANLFMTVLLLGTGYNKRICISVNTNNCK